MIILSAINDIEQQKSFPFFGVNAKRTPTLKNHLVVSYKVKYAPGTEHSPPQLGTYAREIKTCSLKDPYIGDFIHNCQNLETIHTSPF